jgi:hypothetical protein
MRIIKYAQLCETQLAFAHGCKISKILNKNSGIKYMALFVSADIHQGHERFGVHSRENRCAFMSFIIGYFNRTKYLAQVVNITCNIKCPIRLLQGNKMYLNTSTR